VLELPGLKEIPRSGEGAVLAEKLEVVIDDAVESYGFETTGSILGLASYENRVYQIGVAEGFVVVKFYRPGRWSTDAILEEHDFALELAAQDIPVVPPIVHDGGSLSEQDGYRFAVYERRGGRWPELGTIGHMRVRSTAESCIVVASPITLDAVAIEPQTHAPQGLRRFLRGEPGAMRSIEPGEVLGLTTEIAFERGAASSSLA